MPELPVSQLGNWLIFSPNSEIPAFNPISGFISGIPSIFISVETGIFFQNAGFKEA
jgi:hypothetical protein